MRVKQYQFTITDCALFPFFKSKFRGKWNPAVSPLFGRVDVSVGVGSSSCQRKKKQANMGQSTALVFLVFKHATSYVKLLSF